jgi:hypothetical protein
MTDLKSNPCLDKNTPLLLRSDSTAVIHAPVDEIDVPEWLFTLTDEEYQQCSIAHIAGATSRSPRGERMSINVEMAGPALMGTALDRGNRGQAALPAGLAVRLVRSASARQNSARLGHDGEAAV